MEIVYDLTEEDVVALTKIRTATSKRWQRHVNKTRFVYLVSFFILALGIWLMGSNPILSLVFSLMGILLFLLYPAYRSWQALRTTRQAYQAETRRDTLVARTLRINPEGLEEESPYGHILVRWNYFDQVIQTPTHTFLSFDQMPALVIPKNRIKTGDYEAFVRTLQEKQAATNQAPHSISA